MGKAKGLMLKAEMNAEPFVAALTLRQSPLDRHGQAACKGWFFCLRFFLSGFGLAAGSAASVSTAGGR